MLFGTGLCAAGLLSLFYLTFVSRGKTSLAGDVPVGLTGECLCHPKALHASEFITGIPRPAIALNPDQDEDIVLREVLMKLSKTQSLAVRVYFSSAQVSSWSTTAEQQRGRNETFDDLPDQYDFQICIWTNTRNLHVKICQ